MYGTGKTYTPPGFIRAVLYRVGADPNWHEMKLSTFCHVVADWNLHSSLSHEAAWQKLQRGEIVQSPVNAAFSYKLLPGDLEQLSLYEQRGIPLTVPAEK